MKLTESQLRFLIRQELLNTLHENNLIEEGYMSDLLSKYSKYGKYAALGAGLGVGGLEVARPFDTYNTEIAYDASRKVSKMQDMGYILIKKGDMVMISKNSKSIEVNAALIKDEMKRLDYQKYLRKGAKHVRDASRSAKIPFLDDFEINAIDKSMPESKKLVDFIKDDPVVKSEIRKSHLIDYGQVGLVIFALLAFNADLIAMKLQDKNRLTTRIPNFLRNR
jgi:hypothetical protein